MFFGKYMLTQLMHCLKLAGKEIYNTEHDDIIPVSMTSEDDQVFIVAKVPGVGGYITGLFFESCFQMCEVDSKDYGGGKPSIIGKETPEDDEGLLLIFEQQSGFFISNQALLP